MNRIIHILLAFVTATAVAGCSSDADEKPPPPKGPVVAVVLDGSGQRLASIQADGAVEEAEPDGHGGWFVSGQFRNIGGYDRGYVAHVEGDGRVDPDWDATLDRSDTTVTVSARLAVGNGRVYLAGDFGSVNGQKRSGGAALDAETGELDEAWAPQLGIVSNDVALTPDHVIVATGPQVDAYDPVSGRRDPGFRVRTAPGYGGDDDAGVRTLALSGTQLYLGGRFRRVNGVAAGSLARVDAHTGRLDRRWHPPELALRLLDDCHPCEGPVSALALTAPAVYAVGDFNRVGGATARGGLAAFKTAGTGRPAAFVAPRPGRSADGYGGSYGALAVVGSRLLVGGDFGAAPTRGFAALDARTGALVPSPWHPRRRHALVKRIVPSGPNVLVTGDRLGD